MQELIGICDRTMVMRSGRIVGAVTGEHMNENEVVVLATGVKSGEAA
jgi:ribose transport system ATP-binding protein